MTFLVPAVLAPDDLSEYRQLLQVFRALRPDYEQTLLQRLAEAAPQLPTGFTVAELFYLDFAVKQRHHIPLDDADYARLRTYFPPERLQGMINCRLW